MNFSFLFDKYCNLIERLEIGDITHIDIVFENHNEYISVNWDVSNEYINSYQEVSTSDGFINVKIGK